MEWSHLLCQGCKALICPDLGLCIQHCLPEPPRLQHADSIREDATRGILLFKRVFNCFGPHTRDYTALMTAMRQCHECKANAEKCQLWNMVNHKMIRI